MSAPVLRGPALASGLLAATLCAWLIAETRPRQAAAVPLPESEAPDPDSERGGAEPASANRDDLARLLDAIEQVESGGNVHAVGDGGRSLGPLQIQRVYWADAVEHSRRQGDYWDLGSGTYPASVLDRSYARQVVLAYADRYGARTTEEIAKVHNGGPAGARKRATLGYWARVQAAMRP